MSRTVRANNKYKVRVWPRERRKTVEQGHEVLVADVPVAIFRTAAHSPITKLVETLDDSRKEKNILGLPRLDGRNGQHGAGITLLSAYEVRKNQPGLRASGLLVRSFFNELYRDVPTLKRRMDLTTAGAIVLRNPAPAPLIIALAFCEEDKLKIAEERSAIVSTLEGHAPPDFEDTPGYRPSLPHVSLMRLPHTTPPETVEDLRLIADENRPDIVRVKRATMYQGQSL